MTSILWYVAAVVEVGTGLAAWYRHAPASICDGNVGGQIRIQEVDTERGSVRGGRRGAGANYEGFVGPRPVKRYLGLEDLGARVSLRALTNGGCRTVHPRPAAKDEFRDRAQCVGEGGVAPFHASNCDGVVLTNDIIRALQVVCRQIAVGKMVVGQTLMAVDSSALQNRERKPRKPTHVSLVGSPTRGGVDRIIVRKLT